MSEFPRKALQELAANYREAWPNETNFAEQAIAAYDQLAERCVMDTAEHRALIGQLRGELAARTEVLDELEAICGVETDFRALPDYVALLAEERAR